MRSSDQLDNQRASHHAAGIQHLEVELLGNRRLIGTACHPKLAGSGSARRIEVGSLGGSLLLINPLASKAMNHYLPLSLVTTLDDCQQ